ncbi:DUF3617 domain-containing protein [Erythrobacter sp. THAF29]|uniref:DUF3617 domain-containing protein n=1 Tax=Erythrobacter sp. THAF29 TaxID=2587851 RepID=UPI0012697AFA|nr:DUF3617 domain-containing protein [Erythrobacter sp. THAF29]QFT78452.1 hypothetical protein FIU90_12950 [Erythrobacter sp. THAF29]
MKYAFPTILAAFALGACGGSPEPDADGDGSISMAEAADAAAASGLKPEPGLYRVTSQLKGMNMPGVPAEMSGEGLGFTNTMEHCLTPDEVEKGFEEMMKEGQDGTCTYEKFEIDGGSMEGVMNCEGSDGQVRVEFTGTATPTSSEMDATVASNIPGLGEGTMSVNVKQERIGDCKG